MVGVGTVVTPEVRDVTNEFSDLLDVEELPGLGFLSIATAGGVALGQQVVDMVLSRTQFNADPQNMGDFFAAGLVQMVWALIVGFIAVSFIGAQRPALFTTAIALALGSAVIGGANLFEAGQRAFRRISSRAQQSAPQGDNSGPSASETTDGNRPGKAISDGGQPIDEDAGPVDRGSPSPNPRGSAPSKAVSSF